METAKTLVHAFVTSKLDNCNAPLYGLPKDKIQPRLPLGWLHFLGSMITYGKIPKISPRAYIFQRPFLRGLFLERLIFGGAYIIYGGKFAFQNLLD